MATEKKLPIGVSEFEKIREPLKNYYYIDKSMLIADWIASAAEATLITRPRRFGKTLNMTMLREFFDITKDNKTLFEGLAISQTPYITELNQYPVIYLSFKDCKDSKLDNLLCIFDVLRQVVKTLPKDMVLDEDDALEFQQIKQVLTEKDIEKRVYLNKFIYFLSYLLYNHYGKKVIILIDEYDTPMVSAYEGGYYEEVRPFFRSLYSSALKDNPYLERAMLTGIHRIAKENIFSGLNNLKVCTIMDEAYSQYFGLTPEETEKLLQDYDLVLNQSVKDMYDGYLFGSQEIYNPWSVLNYADRKKLAPYWVNTASDNLISQAILTADSDTHRDFEALLSESKVRVPVDLQTSFFEMEQPATLWGLFLNSGYITITEPIAQADELQTIGIPNHEVMTSFKKIIEKYGGFTDNSLSKLFDALLHKDIPRFQQAYENIILTCTSFHDGTVENAYHMLFLGMCVYLSSTHIVKSNIESGHGRADVLLKAKRSNLPNFIIEFKQGEDIDKLAQEALTQIHNKKYYAGFQGETLLLGISHNLKHCQILWDTILV